MSRNHIKSQKQLINAPFERTAAISNIDIVEEHVKKSPMMFIKRSGVSCFRQQN